MAEDNTNDLITKEDILSARQRIKNGPLTVFHTPCIEVNNDEKGLCMFDFGHSKTTLFLKLESMQNTRSFKIRGVSNQFQVHDVATSKKSFVTMSAGNYGKAFSYASKIMGLTGNTVLMPDTAPLERSQGLEKMGVKVERMKSAELLQGVERLQQEHGAVFLHPFDDRHLIAGYGSLGLEILQDVPDADFVLVCCGGGGLLAGTATALAYFATGKRIRVFGVEPETASGMRMSLQAGKAAKCPDAKSVAAGLAPPFAGKNAYEHVRAFVEEHTVSMAYERGLVVEPSGAAALAALLTGKLEAKVGGTELEGKKVVAVITGSNVSPLELTRLLQ